MANVEGGGGGCDDVVGDGDDRDTIANGGGGTIGTANGMDTTRIWYNHVRCIEYFV